MTCTIEEIERDWGITSTAPSVVLDAFERVERILGRDWIAQIRAPFGGHAPGAAPFLDVVSMGGRLGVLDGIEAPERLIARLRRHDRSAEAELTAMHLLHCRNRTAEIELEPDVSARRSVRKADFRIRLPGGTWTYVEVTSPNVSEARERVTVILDRITGLLWEVRREFALEVFFKREPREDELETLCVRIRRFCSEGKREREEVGDLALLILSSVRPGQITPHEEANGQVTARLAMAKVLGGGAQPRRHIVARIPYADQRADKFLADEAAQLDRGYPGLIMVDASGEPAAFTSWGPILARRFQPRIHTRVGGMCLFAPHLLPVENNLLWVLKVQLRVNPHAKLALPEWIREAVEEAARDFGMCWAAAQTPSGAPPESAV